MARPAKPSKIVTSHRSTEEKENRKKAEESMRGKSDKIKNVPRWLDDKAKTEYKKLYEEIKELDICSNLDINALAMIATCMARIKECEEVLKKEGIMVKIEKNGVIVTAEHPAIKTQLKYMDMLKKYMNEVNLFLQEFKNSIGTPSFEENEIIEKFEKDTHFRKIPVKYRLNHQILDGGIEHYIEEIYFGEIGDNYTNTD